MMTVYQISTIWINADGVLLNEKHLVKDWLLQLFSPSITSYLNFVQHWTNSSCENRKQNQIF